MLTQIKALVKKLPGIRELVSQRDALLVALDDMTLAVDEMTLSRDEACTQRDQLQTELSKVKKAQGFVPAGHFYSPIPSIDEIKRDESQIFGSIPDEIPGVDLNETGQLDLLNEFVRYYQELPFKPEKTDGLRYYYENSSYSYSDAILSHCMIRHLRPNRIIEIGSGFSSCMILDTNELYFDGRINTTFIEPYPELIESLLKKTDFDDITIIPSRLQDVDPKEFEALEANDILLIDSTHISKINSDVNRIFFDILPSLAAGVYVHFHDVTYPFEYPKRWVLEGRAWNEAYILRAFLQYNPTFRVVLMNSYMDIFHTRFFEENLPLCRNNAGSSVWLCKE